MADPTFVFGKISRCVEDEILEEQDRMAAEEPLEIRLGSSAITVTMRTPGHDRELAAGFLYSEGIIHASRDIADTIEPGRDRRNVLCVKLRRGVRFDRDRLRRDFYATSSCGICGKTTLEAIQVKANSISSAFTVSLATLYSLPARLRDEQEIFAETGGLHAAAIFDGVGNLVYLREDVGRHNAVDKVVGAALLDDRIPLDRHILMVSGRASFEIMQKALVARIPVVAAVSAPSSLAVALARKFKMTLVGFLRDQRCNVYAGKQRVGV